MRQLAIARLETTGRRLGRLDPILDVVNITLLVLIPVVLVVSSPAG